MTEVLPLDPEQPAPDTIRRAAEVLRRGGLVAFPTETVYGLGANALDPRAVERIFAAKGRPATNPLIVHIASWEDRDRVAAAWPATAARLAARFWPGPLTLVLPKTADVPEITTAGGPTVAVRWPAHPVALALIRAAGVPLAAPSANRSSGISPTRAEHVLKSLRGRIELVLDGGPTRQGLESTVVDLAGAAPRLLRPGPIAAAELVDALGEPLSEAEPSEIGPERSPGRLARHYAPSVPAELVPEPAAGARVAACLAAGEIVGWLRLGPRPAWSEARLEAMEMPHDPAAYAARLYEALHELEDRRVTRIVIDAPPAGEGWRAVRDRLQRATTAEQG